MSKYSQTERYRELERIVSQYSGGSTSPIVDCRSLAGGCIHEAEVIELQNGCKYFVKASPSAKHMFEEEMAGLQALADTDTLRVPNVVGCGSLPNDEHCLVLEFVESGSPAPSFFRVFGVQLAELHAHDHADKFGWPADNFLGTTRQQNTWQDSWPTFFTECRLGPQLNQLRRLGRGSDELYRRGEQLLPRVSSLLGCPGQPACLIHGDLWNGNYLCDEKGKPTIFDPAASYSHREAELAMPLLFGGFPTEFYDAYNDRWPMEDGWRDRLELYKLYHLFNHLNLFGQGYLSSCLDILRRFT